MRTFRIRHALSALAVVVTIAGLALPTAQPVDAQWAAQVTRHTIARIPTRIPKVPGLP